MNSKILNNKIQEFINNNVDSDISKLALKKNSFPEVDYNLILEQIESKNRCKKKLPTFFDTKNIYYPSKISIEQTSSEKTAKYKSSIISGKFLIDLTGGFGIDDYYFSQKIDQIVHCEINKELSEIVKYNFNVLEISNIKCINADSLDHLQTYLDNYFDWIYIDPSRRNDIKGKVFMLKDCLPNVVDNLSTYFNYSKNILIKTAPILDLSAGLKELQNVKEIHIIAIDNEVKEILWILEKQFIGEIEIKTININKNKEAVFNFILNKNLLLPTTKLPEKYLYEPNAAIMKSGGFNEVAISFNLSKLHQFSHLYTKNSIITFPGRTFIIEKEFFFNKSNVKRYLANTQANVTIRNFPAKVEEIRRKFNIKDGGNCYCFFTTNANDEKIVLICKKI